MGKGLSSRQAENLLKKFGPNEIVEGAKKNPLSILVSQFTSFLIFLLFLAAIISLALGDIIDGIFILLIVVLNGILGFVQEFKAEKAIDALKRVTISTVRVFRDGQEQPIDSRFLVPTDVIFVEEGTKISADGRIIESFNLEVNEAPLSGESMPVMKEVGTSDERSLVFSGTTVVRGRALIEINKTGMGTRFGKIAGSLSSIYEEKTPLEKNLALLGKQLAIIGIGLSALVFFLSFIRERQLFVPFLTSVSLAVAAIPEGLPAVMTITLAVGLQRMSKRRAIVRKLSAIEALGSVSVVLSDKTGTLTRGEMTARRIFADGEIVPVSSLESENISGSILKILEIGGLCNTASLVLKRKEEGYAVVGDSTEGALLFLGAKLNHDRESFLEDFDLVAEMPFDPKKRLMTVVLRAKNQPGVEIMTKGAAESILPHCLKQLFKGSVLEMKEEMKIQIKEAVAALSKSGLRVLAFAYRALPSFEGERRREEIEEGLTFVGLIGIADPPREEVASSIHTALNAGISTVMVTGDNELTASAIASEINLIGEGEGIIRGDQIDNLSDEVLDHLISNTRIFARATPEHKLRLVRSFKRLGYVVAVTGDGVNDALALKQADVGIAMGITGTDVAKEASDIVITDDNYSTIITAIEEGRVIFDNIVKSVVYLVACNLGEVVAIIAAVGLGLPSPLIPIQILWMNLVTDGLPALALAVDKRAENVMRRKPRLSTEGILTARNLNFIFTSGIIVGLMTLAFYTLILRIYSLELARTIAFTLLIVLQMIMAFVVRGSRRIFENRLLLLAVTVSLVFQLLILTVPALKTIFEVGF